jgi:hypothetical protein
MALPCVEAVRARCPSATLAVAARTQLGALYEMVSGVDEVVRLEPAGRLGGWLAALRDARRLRGRRFDVAILLPTIRELTERQYQLFFLFQTAIARHTPEGFARLNDDDVAGAAAALAATFETAARGVIYEHAPESPVARRLADDLRSMLDEMKKQGAKVYDHETAVVLRAIESGARDVRKQSDGAADAYLTLVGRLLRVNRLARSDSPPDQPASSLVLP